MVTAGGVAPTDPASSSAPFSPRLITYLRAQLPSTAAASTVAPGAFRRDTQVHFAGGPQRGLGCTSHEAGSLRCSTRYQYRDR
ncbi:hypothetical protein HN51_031040 [Arachis hypogaea]